MQRPPRSRNAAAPFQVEVPAPCAAIALKSQPWDDRPRRDALYSCRNSSAPLNQTTPEGAAHGRDRPQDQRRGHQSALQLGPRAAGARHHGGRFRGAGRLPPAAPLPPRPRQAGARQFRARRAAGYRCQQYPLSSPRPRSANGSATRSAAGRCSPATARPDPVGFRLGGRASPAVLPWLPPENCKAGLLGLRGTVTLLRADGRARRGNLFAHSRGRLREDAGRQSTSSSRRCCSNCRRPASRSPTASR